MATESLKKLWENGAIQRALYQQLTGAIKQEKIHTYLSFSASVMV
jgi:hypothetical protein